ncbi:MAG: M56 family metallopeptidase, partial [Thermoanaerobaculia bacterium]|nr:M56 family metallopeptidase [Thermoanaerobaculia bacterium]
MSGLSYLQTGLPPSPSSFPEVIGAHLIVATILSGGLLAASFIVRDPRIRRAAALAALIVFLVPIPDLLPDRGLEALQIPLFDISVDGTAEAPPAVSATPVDAVSLVLAIWLAVAILLLGRTARALAAPSAGGDELADLERERLGVPADVAVRLSRTEDSPHVKGLFDPKIVIPESLVESATAEELEAVILHELAHVRQRDNLWGVISAVTTNLFWFHPFVWLAALRFRASSEVVCDAAVLGAGIPLQTYLESLHKLIAAKPSKIDEMALGGGSLKERIRIMKSSAPTLSRLASRLAIVSVALVTLGAGLSLRAVVGNDSPVTSAFAAGDSVTAYRIAHQVTPQADGAFRADFAIIDLA